MEKIISYILTPIFYIVFGIILLIFHPLQWACFSIFGYQMHKSCVSLFNWCLIRSNHILGTTYKFRNPHKIPTDKPLIIVSNHQSMFEISPLSWWFRKHHPKFVSKKELGKGIPSVSFNLRNGGSALIDRKDSKQALIEIRKLGTYIEKHHRSAVIFPEGTRSRTGVPKDFQRTGLKILMKNAPSALIVPVSINNSWKLLKYGKFPYGLGNRMTFDVHNPIEIKGDLDSLIDNVELLVKSGITSFK